MTGDEEGTTVDGPVVSRRGQTREHRLADTFVTLADTLTEDFDLARVHQRLVQACVDVLSAASAGLALADASGRLVIVATTTGSAAEFAARGIVDGPAHDCHRTGVAVPETDIAASAERWPRFAAVARGLGFRTVRSLPLRLRGQTLGALNLYGDDRTAIAPEDVRIAQSLADVATIALLQHRAVAEGEQVADQLRNALGTRIVVEQAKGMLAERGGIDVEAAFDRLRAWARSRRVGISDVARDLVEGRGDVDEVLRGG